MVTNLQPIARVDLSFIMVSRKLRPGRDICMSHSWIGLVIVFTVSYNGTHRQVSDLVLCYNYSSYENVTQLIFNL